MPWQPPSQSIVAQRAPNDDAATQRGEGGFHSLTTFPRHPTAVKILVLVVNLAVVAYLLYRIYKEPQPAR